MNSWDIEIWAKPRVGRSWKPPRWDDSLDLTEISSGASAARRWWNNLLQICFSNHSSSESSSSFLISALLISRSLTHSTRFRLNLIISLQTPFRSRSPLSFLSSFTSGIDPIKEIHHLALKLSRSLSIVTILLIQRRILIASGSYISAMAAIQEPIRFITPLPAPLACSQPLQLLRRMNWFTWLLLLRWLL